MSHIYQNCQRADGLAWTAWMKNQNIAAMNIILLKTHRDSRILHSRTAKKIVEPELGQSQQQEIGLA